jgi:outer membrane lipoprotein LolB
MSAGRCPSSSGIAAALLLSLLIAGCAQLGVPSGQTLFELNGRIAARYGAESFSGTLAWRHAEGADEMLLSTPLGQGVARIVRQGESVILTTAEPREYRATDAEALTEQVLGFRVPLAGLADWVRGRPAPELEARGWKVEYQGYDAERRPTRLRITYPGIELRLAISEWK